ncbi:hypothetical protein [Janthinobacterium psychrotolerans]|uniref:Uncharacterized protein n=1 Tax=Janthinobacterium psychrotolerans TaxID=1747903 RepID=A0A1A7CAF3_9BURK|nr:hypothetical protein [Janthinobacterium psychrotolerans]OBV41288.1 hypothetical protein ASR47_102744 [Janthinobacterium psychrotolerans]
MTRVSLNYLLLSLFILLFGTTGGAAMTRKLANRNDELGWRFFWWWLPFCLALFLCQCLLFPKARTRLLYQLLFMGSIAWTLTFFMLSIILPVFWLSPMAVQAKGLLAAIFAAIFLYNMVFGWRLVNRRWADLAAPAFEQEFKPREGSVNWDKVVRKMRIEPAILIPGVPASWAAIVWIVFIIGMIAGLFMRSCWPAFSAFSWSIPLVLITACLSQVSGAAFAQAVKVRAIERDRHILLPSCG